MPRLPFLRHALLAGWTAAVFGFLYLPIAPLIVYSFNDSALDIRWAGFTLRWYGTLLGNAALLDAFKNSLFIAVCAALTSTALGVAGAWLMHRRRLPRAIAAPLGPLILAPMLMPEILMGVSLLLWFVFLRLPLGFLTVIIAHVTFCFPFVLVMVRARLEGLDPSLEEAALDLGARPWQAFWLVIVPYLMPAIVGGALLAFTLSLDEYVVTVFTNGPGSQTLPQKVFGLAKIGLNPQLNALSAVFLLTAAVLALTAETLRRKRPSLPSPALP
jgi:spermidine/putrescine transport system permease protein